MQLTEALQSLPPPAPPPPPPQPAASDYENTETTARVSQGAPKGPSPWQSHTHTVTHPPVTQSHSHTPASQIFRLSRLSESLLVILTSVLKVNPGSTSDWTSESASLLSLLLSYERYLAQEGVQTDEKGKREYPPFLKEFHSVWKAQEERNQLQSIVADKDREIAALLTGTVGHPPSSQQQCTKCSHETALLQVVEAIRAKIGTPDTGVCAESLVAELQKARNAVAELEGQKEELTDHSRKLEKKMAALLKKQEELKATSGGTGDNKDQQNLQQDGQNETTPNSHRKRHPIFSSADQLDAFEAAKEAWKSERRMLQMAKEEKEKLADTLKRRVGTLQGEVPTTIAITQVQTMESDMEAISKKYARVLSQLEKANEAMQVIHQIPLLFTPSLRSTTRIVSNTSKRPK